MIFGSSEMETIPNGGLSACSLVYASLLGESGEEGQIPVESEASS